MNLLKLTATNLVSLSLIFTPTYLLAQTPIQKLDASIIQTQNQIRSLEQELTTLGYQGASISYVLNHAKTKGYAPTEAFFTGTKFAIAAASTVGGVSVHIASDNLSAAQLKALSDYFESARKIANEANAIIGAEVRLQTKFYANHPDAAVDYTTVTAKFNKEKLVQLDRLYEKYSSKEMSAAAQFIAKEQNGSWWTVKKALATFSTSKLNRAVQRASMRAKVFTGVGMGAFIGGMVYMASHVVSMLIYSAANEGKDILSNLPQDLSQIAVASRDNLDNLAQSGQKAELEARITDYSVRSVAISTQIITKQGELASLNNQLAQLNASKKAIEDDAAARKLLE
tara:strand:+ start:16917 stop:17939 length:1023 start_codon:yes stop_codon:yes gene_type:complete